MAMRRVFMVTPSSTESLWVVFGAYRCLRQMHFHPVAKAARNHARKMSSKYSSTRSVRDNQYFGSTVLGGLCLTTACGGAFWMNYDRPAEMVSASAAEPSLPPPSSSSPSLPGEDAYISEQLSIVVVGATTDLSKEKTFPALYTLFKRGLLSPSTKIYALGQNALNERTFRRSIESYLREQDETEGLDSSLSVPAFLNMCKYQQGECDSVEAMKAMKDRMRHEELRMADVPSNRLFYFALSTQDSLKAAACIKKVHAHVREDGSKGWTRFVVENSFDSSTASANGSEATETISSLFDEKSVYRMNSALGMEMVQNMLVMRFANSYFEPIWNRNHVAAVYMTYKESAKSERSSDGQGVIRDVIQKHLLQILSLVAMEAPENIRNCDGISREKMKILNAITPIKSDHVVLGKLEDAASSKEETSFATLVLYIDNPRWQGVPFIIKAGKGMDQEKMDVRVQLKKAPGAERMFGHKECPRNEIVMRLTPNESVYIRTNLKAPGLSMAPVQSELDLTYRDRYGDAFESFPDAHARMLLNVLRGDASLFLRDEEMRRTLDIFGPICDKIQDGQIRYHEYARGSRGPDASDQLAICVGYDGTTIQRRLAAGPRDDRPIGGGYTARELKVYIEDPASTDQQLSFGDDHMPECFD